MNKIYGTVKSYIIDVPYNKSSIFPQLRLDFLTAFQNVKKNQKVIIKCSSDSGNEMLYLIYNKLN
jgi:hypothetical protein